MLLGCRASAPAIDTMHQMVRLYVGGLPQDIKKEDVAARFVSFGTVGACELSLPKNIEPAGRSTATCRGFAYVELQPKDEVSLARCLSLVRMLLTP